MSDTEAMMTLEGFVQQSLTEILRGIHAAQGGELGDYVAPPVREGARIDPSFGVAWHGGDMFTVVQFDVAVTAESSRSKAGGGALAIPIIGAKLERGTTNESKDHAVSRLRFSVHVRLPNHGS